MRPVFIVGCPRSGTTVLGSILGSAPNCAMIPTTEFMRDLYVADAKHPGQAIPKSQLIAASLEKTRFRNQWGSDWFDVDSLESMPVRPFLEHIIRRYCARNYDRPFSVWIDHTPENNLLLQTLATVFPEAKILHLVRDARAVIASMMDLDWGVTTVVDGVQIWLKHISCGLAAESDPRLAGRITRVTYERLLADPKTTLQSICAFADIEFRDDLHTRRSFKIPETAKTVHRLVDKPLSPERINAWSEKLTRRQAEIIEYCCGSTLAHLGYPLSFGIAPRRPTAKEKVDLLVRRTLMKPVQRVKYRWRNRQLGLSGGRPLRKPASGGAAIR